MSVNDSDLPSNAEERPRCEDEGIRVAAAEECNYRVPIKFILLEVGRRAHERSAELAGADHAGVLMPCVADWPEKTTITVYLDGKRDTRDGVRTEVTWAEFHSLLVDQAPKVVAKGTGVWFMAAGSSNGRCRDEDIEDVHQLGLDADGVGDWERLRSLFDNVGIAYVLQQSSSSTASVPKFHAHIPLTVPWRGTKREFRMLYRHCVAWFSAVGALQSDLNAEPPLYGFDRSTDRMGQPFFPSARRTVDHPVPQTIRGDGGALDLARFLRLTGFDAAAAEAAAADAMPPRHRRPRHARASVAGSSGQDSLLLSAFREAGMLGPHIGDGKYVVQCPTESCHTCGTSFDGSTLLFPPQGGSDLGWFHCSHAHCAGGSPEEVLDLLPRSAVAVAWEEIEILRETRRNRELLAFARRTPGISENQTNGSGNRVPDGGEDDADHPAPDGWDPPLPLQQAALPPFPTDALPAVLADWVAAEATATGTPPELAAGLLLALVSAILAKLVEVLITPGWVEPVNVFICIVLGPGNRKSAVARDVLAPLLEHERSVIAKAATGAAGVQARHAIAKKAYEQAVAAAAKRDPKATADVEKLAKALEATSSARVERHLADDATPEAIALLMAEQDGRIANINPEGGVFGMMAGRYSNDPNIEVYLKGHAGDDIRVDRVGRSPLYIHRPALTLGLAVQPDVLLSAGQKRELRGQGLLARMLFMVPASLVGRRPIGPPPVPVSVARAFRALIQRLLQWPARKDENGELVPRMLTFAPAALAHFTEFQKELEPMLGEDASLGDIADWGAKLVGAVGRIAALLEVARCNQPPMEVSYESVDGAIRIGRFLLPHARAAFAMMADTGGQTLTRYVLTWIERTGVRAFTKRKLYSALRARVAQARDFDEPLEQLMDCDYIRLVPREHPGRGRKPSPLYEVSPFVGKAPRSGRVTLNSDPSDVPHPVGTADSRFEAPDNTSRTPYNIYTWIGDTHDDNV